MTPTRESTKAGSECLAVINPRLVRLHVLQSGEGQGEDGKRPGSTDRHLRLVLNEDRAAEACRGQVHARALPYYSDSLLFLLGDNLVQQSSGFYHRLVHAQCNTADRQSSMRTLLPDQRSNFTSRLFF